MSKTVNKRKHEEDSGTSPKKIKTVEKQEKYQKKTKYAKQTKAPLSKSIKPTNKSGPKKPFLNKDPRNNSSHTKPLVKKDGEKLPPPNWAEIKKQKKELRETRRTQKVSKSNPEAQPIITKAKHLSEKLRRKKGTPDERNKIIQELHTLLMSGKQYKQLVLAHDTSRIIQWLLKFASPKIRAEISQELMELMADMIQSKYARNCVKRILKYGTENVRDQVLKSLHGNIVKLASHTLSASILDYAYEEIANKKHKLYMHQEFYGDIYKTNKDDKIHSLSDTYKTSPEMKSAMLGATKANLLRILNKNVHDCGLVHAVLYEYLRECSAEDRSELITTLCPLIAPLSNSKAGVKAAVTCVWHGTNKDKKTIMKVVKEHAIPLSIHEHGHQLVLALLSGVDDTVLLGKALLSTLLAEPLSLLADEWGRKVLVWMVAPGDHVHFHPSLVQWLQSGAQQGGCKKPQDVRATEVLQVALLPLVSSLQNQPELWLASGNSGLVTVALLKAATGDSLKTSLDSVSEYICRADWKVTEDEKQVDGVEHSGLHSCLKKLAQHDKIRADNQQHSFGESICAYLKSDVASKWIETNRGCFLLVTLLENNPEEVQAKLKKILLPHATKIKKQSTAGARILLSKIA